jgi:hypothetical protein
MVDDQIKSSTEMYDIQGNRVYENSDSDGLFMDIEPYSGIALAAAINA